MSKKINIDRIGLNKNIAFLNLLTTLVIFLILLISFPVFAEKSKTINSNSYKILLEDGISLHLTVAQFDAKKHKITKCQILDWTGICLIDGKPVFGTDWGLPRNQLIKADIIIGSKRIKLDVSCMYNVSPTLQDFTLEKVEGGFLIRGRFSDGAGSYEAEWLIIQNSSVRTLLGNKEC